MAYSTRCFKLRIRPGFLDRVRQWSRTLNESRRDEALATLRDETVIIEATFLDRTADGDFLIAFVVAESFDECERKAAASTHLIDEEHFSFKRDALERGTALDTLLDLNRIAELARHD